MYLAALPRRGSISQSGVWRILKRLDLNRLPASQRYKRHDKRWKRYEKQLPGHRVQIDVKFIEPPIAARPPRPAQVLPVHRDRRLHPAAGAADLPALNQKTAIQFLDYVLERLPFQVQVIQTDNGAEFQSAFHWHVLDKGIGHRLHQAPHTPPQRQGRDDPTASTPKSSTALLDGVVIDDANVFNDKLQEWEDYYNYHRPHGGLGGQTPYERLSQKTQTRP